MRRLALGLLFVLCVAAASAPAGAQTLIGWIDSPPADASIVYGANSAFLVQGWAAGTEPVDRVDVLVDGIVVASANSFYPRADVAAAFPLLPSALTLHSGWAVYIDSTALTNGMHTISAVAVRLSHGGSAPESVVIGTRSVQVDNASLNLHPFGALEYPNDESTVPKTLCAGAPSGPVVCQVSPCFGETGGAAPGTLLVHATDLNPVRGWVLDTGARSDAGQTGYVQLLIDGVIIADTRQDCALLSGAFANCYGVNRPDIEKQYPGFVNSDNSGYVFNFAAVDDGTGHLVIYVPVGSTTAATVSVRSVTTIVPGKHDISVRAGDVAETVSLIGNPISVDFLPGCVPGTTTDHPAFGAIETPVPFQLLSDTQTISGWAFDPDGFSCDPGNSSSHIDVDIDGLYKNIVTQQPCGVPCPPGQDCPSVLNNCEPSSPGSSYADSTRLAQWCGIRADVPPYDIRVPSAFSSPHPPCSDSPATWTAGEAKVGWSFDLDTTQLANGAHDLNVYASDCSGHRTLIGRRRFVVFNELSRQTVAPTSSAKPAPAAQRHP